MRMLAIAPREARHGLALRDAVSRSRPVVGAKEVAAATNAAALTSCGPMSVDAASFEQVKVWISLNGIE